VEANARVDRALRAGALALGARVEIDTLPGYLPLACDATMTGYFRETAHALVGAEHYRELGHRAGSTDMGDLSQVIPVLHPYMGGARGSGHGPDYEIVDEALAYVAPAKALAAMAVDRLERRGRARRLAQRRPAHPRGLLRSSAAWAAAKSTPTRPSGLASRTHEGS
jgi:metal-dependent amidase/aminoacylase/carboxypeptidase family protein